MGIRAVTDASFKQDVLQSDKPVLVDFWAEWCAPCRKVSPLLEEIASEMPERLEIVKLNADENPDTVRTYQVMSLPTMMIFKDGKQVKAFTGARPKLLLVQLIESAL